MKKNILYLCALCAMVALAAACSSTKNAKPGGARKVAGTQTSTSAPVREVLASAPATPAATGEKEEVTRSENFRLAEGEKASGVIGKKYHVVVGSFKSRDNAKGLQTTLAAEGNEAVVVINEQGMYRVFIASYDTYGEARTCINRIANRFPDAWVLTVK